MRRALLLALGLAGACSRTGVEYGEELFNSPSGLSDSEFNPFSCADCHTVTPTAEDDLIRPGYPLHGAAARERWWGGQEITLAGAVDTCIIYFMRGEALEPESDRAKGLYEYLLSISPDGSPSDTLPFHLVENVMPLPAGDMGRGADLYRRACQHCHGETHTGKGSILRKARILPELVAEYDELFPADVPRGFIVTEVVRHGRFFDVGGTMPPFSTELLSDEQLADILAYLELSSTPP